MPKLTYRRLINQHLKILKDLQYKSGLFAASSPKVKTGYDKSWLRDNFYECLAFEVLGDWDTVDKTYDSLLKIFLKHEYKIDYAIKKKPVHKHEYIHARYNPETFDEFWEEWGNKQNDAVGALLFKIGELHEKGIEVKSGSWEGLAEESPGVYKDVNEVCEVSHQVGIASKVVRLVPLSVIKG